MFVGIRFIADEVTKKWEKNFAFGADDLAGVGGLVFGHVKTPGAVYDDIVFKPDFATDMIVGSGSARLVERIAVVTLRLAEKK